MTIWEVFLLQFVACALALTCTLKRKSFSGKTGFLILLLVLGIAGVGVTTVWLAQVVGPFCLIIPAAVSLVGLAINGISFWAHKKG